MGKAIDGAIELAGAVGLGAVAFFTDGAALAIPGYAQAMYGLGMMGISSEIGAIGQALSTNRGTNIVTKNSSANRGIEYGTQRIGGVYMYESTTGGKKSYLNYVVVISGHLLSGIIGLYLDGRRVYFKGGVGNSVRNGVPFGGTADSNDHIGPDGLKYNFGGEVYAEACYGDQINQPNTVTNGGFNTGLYANDPVWGPSPQGLPYLGGCAYLYIKVVYDTNLFPGKPEIRVDVMGKPVFDPRSNTTGYTSNPALIVADILKDENFGIGGLVVNQAQLIAAANICDEQVTLASGLTESRYSCHWHYDTGTAPGDAINQVLATMGGRISFVGGEWYIFPASYVGPDSSFGLDDLVAPVEWNSHRSSKDVFNRVNGTFSPPAYPYQISGNAYDKNGYAFDGTGTPNTFALAYQATNYPSYAADALHGYATDQWLNEDGGRELPKELDLAGVLSIAQAQRLAKICLLRNRLQQGSGTLEMGLSAMRLKPGDTFYMTFPDYGWDDKLLEVTGWKFNCSPDDSGIPRLSCTVDVQETTSVIYGWEVSEELTIYDNPARPAVFTGTPAPPALPMQLVSSAATALVAPDGTVTPRIGVTWNVPEDGTVSAIQVQYQQVGASAWTDSATVDVANTAAFISPVVAGQQYNVRIRSLRPSGAVSQWVEVDEFTAGLVLSQLSNLGVGIGSLVSEAYGSGNAAIDVLAFSAQIGSASIPILPNGYQLTSSLTNGVAGVINQAQRYDVYYSDPNFQGGAVTPIATQSSADWQNKPGVFLIDSIVTLSAATSSGGSGSGQQYSPSYPKDVGTRSTQNPQAAYDGDPNTVAVVSGNAPANGNNTTNGDLILNEFASVLLTYDSLLTVNISAQSTVTDDDSININCIIGQASTAKTLTGSETQVTFAIPANTNLSTVGCEIVATAAREESPDQPSPVPGQTYSPTFIAGRASVSISEVFIK